MRHLIAAVIAAVCVAVPTAAAAHAADDPAATSAAARTSTSLKRCIAKAKKKHGRARARAIARCERRARPKRRPAPPAGSTRTTPIPLGTPATVGPWQVTVLSSTPNATAQVLAENQFNDPPAPGTQFFIARVRATYTGPGSESIFLQLSFGAVGDSNVAYTTFEDSCGVVPDELPKTTELFTGGTVEGNVCWAIRSGDASSLTGIADTDEARVFLALR
jgi:hypothetical protein